MKRLYTIFMFLLPLVLPLYVVRFKIGPLPTTLLEIIVLASFGGWLAFRRAEGVRTAWRELAKWRWPVLAWLIATLIAVAIAPDKLAAFGHWRAFMLEPILIFFMLADVLKSENRAKYLDALFYGISLACIALGIYAIYQFFTGFGIPSPWNELPGRRSTGIFGFPNGLSLFVAPFGAVCFMEWIRRVQDGEGLALRLMLMLGSGLAIVSAIMAKSLGGILALGVGITLTLIINKKTRLLGIVAALVGVSAVGIVGFRILSTQLRADQLDETLYMTKRWSSMVRTVIYQESWALIKDNPIMGTGLRSYQTAIAPYHKATWMEIFPHPHNMILMLWIETGLLGLLAFIWICTTWIMNVARRTSQSSNDNKDERRRKSDVGRLVWLIPLIVILVHGMVDMPYFKNDLAIQFWLLAALATLVPSNLTAASAVKDVPEK